MSVNKILILSALILSFSACRQSEHNITAEEITSPKTEVSIGFATDTIQLSDDVSLNATASYLLKSDVKANATGYITGMNIKLGDRVNIGATLFTLQTKEARALGNTINKLDASFRFNGNSSVQSPSAGYVIMVNHQTGDYVQDGEVLATVNDASSFGFVMDVPYEYLALLKKEKSILLTLPDGMHTTGVVAKIMPSADPVSQTVKVLVKVANKDIPENLIATVTFEKGLETNKWAQVVSGNIASGDRIIISGNFGLADTALIHIQNQRR